MKILMLCPQFRPLTGGYERAAERLSVALAARGHAVTVITERREATWAVREDMGGVTVRRLWCLYRRGLHAMTSQFSFGLWLLLHGRSYAVWHVHQYGAHATLAVLLGKLLRRPVVLKLTSSGVQGVDTALSALRLARWHRWAHRRVAACIAVSDETAQEARVFGVPTQRIHAISNGVDTERLRPVSSQTRHQIRQRLSIGDGFVALAVGRLAVVKNPIGMLHAWARALPHLPADAQLIWVGDGPLHAEAMACITHLGLSMHVRLAGHSDDVPSWLASADVFALSSHTEGMPNAVLEAMACGLPSIATAVSGTTQLLVRPDAGVVVPIGDMDALAGAVVRLAGDSDLRTQMGQRARALIEAEYSIGCVANRIERLYEQITRDA